MAGEWHLLPGQDLMLGLPNGSGLVPGRVVRCKGGFLVIVLQQDGATRDLVTAAIETRLLHAAA